MACNCPLSVETTLAFHVQKSLDQITRIKYLTNVFNDVFKIIVRDVTDDLQAWINTIPDPPIFTLTELAKFITCPLTPMALLASTSVLRKTDGSGNVQIALDVSLLQREDPRILYYFFASFIETAVTNVKTQYKVDTDNLRSRLLIRKIQTYLREIRRTLADPFDFAVTYPISLGIVSYIKATCPEVYEDSRWPYKAFVNELADWDFNGLVPANLDSAVSAIVSKVAQAEAKIQAWENLLTEAV